MHAYLFFYQFVINRLPNGNFSVQVDGKATTIDNKNRLATDGGPAAEWRITAQPQHGPNVYMYALFIFYVLTQPHAAFSSVSRNPTEAEDG